MENKDKSVFYVGIGQPVELRRQILECSRDILRSLQKYENVKIIREKKVECISILKDMMADLKRLNSKLKLEIPNAKIIPKRKKTPERKHVKKPLHEHVDVGNLQMLEDELNLIEAKLDKLSK